MMNVQAWHMGGYAVYVWPSVVLVLSVLAWNVIAARRQLQAAQQRALRLLAARSVDPK